MIRTERGTVTFNGSKSEVLADLSCIVESLHISGKATKEEIMKTVELGFKSQDELDKVLQELEEKAKAKLADIFSILSNDLRGGDKHE